MKKITINKLYHINFSIIVDVRERKEFEIKHLNNSINIPAFELTSNPQNYIKKDDIVCLICQTGYRSKKVAKKLSKMGFNVFYVKNGLDTILY